MRQCKKTRSTEFDRTRSISISRKSKKISNNKEPLQQTTTTASDRPKIGSTNIALKKQSMDLNKIYKNNANKTTPYPSSSKFYLKYGVVVETNTKNIVINNNIEKRKSPCFRHVIIPVFQATPILSILK